MACKIAFGTSAHTDQDKVHYTWLHLEGPPKGYFNRLWNALKALAHAAYTWDQFQNNLIHVYGDPGHCFKKANKLMRLTQKGSAATYTSHFIELASHTDWNDTTMQDMYLHGLKLAVQEQLALEGTGHMANFSLLVAHTITVDSQMFEATKNQKTIAPGTY